MLPNKTIVIGILINKYYQLRLITYHLVLADLGEQNPSHTKQTAAFKNPRRERNSHYNY